MGFHSKLCHLLLVEEGGREKKKKGGDAMWEMSVCLVALLLLRLF